MQKHRKKLRNLSNQKQRPRKPDSTLSLWSITKTLQKYCTEHNGRAGFKRRAQQVFIGEEPQEAGSWVQGQVEGHSQGIQKGNSTGRKGL
jgi:hypothetical protein